MSYQQFAYYYDELMESAPYSHWVEYFKKKSLKYEFEGNRVLDLGCGTGSFSIRLAKEGYAVTGVDLSSEMLMIAKVKAEKENVMLSLFEQDMRSLEGLGEFDAVTIFCDSLNYLLTEEDVLDAFHSARSHLKSGGLLFFDVHTIYKMQHIFLGNTFGSNEEHLSYIWQCYEGEWPDSVEHDLSFFVRNGTMYDRFDELHIQRTFSADTFAELLKKAGFQLLETTADFIDGDILPESERQFFIARKTS
ncbi:class I SAM-dependent DNA methyltransferase [Fictibacillus aquaticus]|uniref:SAM-dependent methyltransferase n=1 Tax=Fictibacillus aquaticus TaxID=2021314 RepID=A0A235FAK2_9BACL|nr:class I SAM-dependent methyltransferase [Fictibacillus aquaticus]OYD57983.1 SAM-dependent methyltransferase [Fictibacillus aquaticus]